MLAYAAHRRSQRRLSPSALTLIVGGHAIALALLITAKMDVTDFKPPVETETYNVPLPPPPPVEPKVEPRTPQDNRLPPPPDSHIEAPPAVVPLPQPGPSFDPGPMTNSMAPDIGPALNTPLVPPQSTPLPPPAAPVKVGPRAITPPDLLRPPYPESKQRTEEEAVLRLRLAIDARGRVTAVEPVGAADPAFLAAARGHLIRHWRYRPATEDGRAVSSSLTITLRFQLED
jgi:protein TonB